MVPCWLGSNSTARVACFFGSEPKRFTKSLNCWLSGWFSPPSHDRTKVCAIPILAATWPEVRFFSMRSTFIQSPIVLMLSGNGLAGCLRVGFCLNLTRICRCAIPNRAPLGSAVAEARADKEGESSPVAESSDDSSGRRVHGSGELRASLDFTFSGICGFLMGICTIA